MKHPKIILGIAATLSLTACDEHMTNAILSSIPTGGTTTTNTPAPLTNNEVIAGLKEALSVGIKKSAASASNVDGFYKNASLFIPFPEEAIKVKDKMDALGLSNQTDKFVMTLNRAAEEATKGAAPIFMNAIKNMSVADGFAILKGGEGAATQFLKDNTTAELTQKFTPTVEQAIQKVELTKFWSPIIDKYNKIPFVEKQNPDLTSYVTERAIDGLFLLVKKEENLIRKDPVARVTDLLKRVFGGS